MASDWRLLKDLVFLCEPATIAVWCLDGLIDTRARKVVEHIFDTEGRQADVNQYADWVLPPDFWEEHRLGNLKGEHWNTGCARFDAGVAPRGLGMFVTAIAFYEIELRHDQLWALQLKREHPHSLAQKSTRAPAFKTGRPPNDDEILAKADELKDGGMKSRQIAEKLRLEPGFENVGTVEARNLLKGRWGRGRPARNKRT